jgi:hypothetical protein
VRLLLAYESDLVKYVLLLICIAAPTTQSLDLYGSCGVDATRAKKMLGRIPPSEVPSIGEGEQMSSWLARNFCMAFTGQVGKPVEPSQPTVADDCLNLSVIASLVMERSMPCRCVCWL